MLGVQALPRLVDVSDQFAVLDLLAGPCVGVRMVDDGRGGSAGLGPTFDASDEDREHPRRKVSVSAENVPDRRKLIPISPFLRAGGSRPGESPRNKNESAIRR
jgi:hypothetical protein